MKELINKVYEEKLKDGSIEKIIGEQIASMVKDCCKSLFEWNGAIKKQMKDKINNVMAGVIENTSFENYVNAFTIVIDETLKNTCLGKYNTICQGLKTLFEETEEMPKQVNLSDVFAKWCDSLEDEVVSYSDVDDGYVEDGKYQMSVRMEVENSHYSSETKKIRFFIDDSGLNDDRFKEDHELKFEIYNNPGYLQLGEVKLRDLRHMDLFTAYCAKLNANFSKIYIDKCEIENCVNIEVEY